MSYHLEKNHCFPRVDINDICRDTNDVSSDTNNVFRDKNDVSSDTYDVSLETNDLFLDTNDVSIDTNNASIDKSDVHIDTNDVSLDQVQNNFKIINFSSSIQSHINSGRPRLADVYTSSSFVLVRQCRAPSCYVVFNAFSCDLHARSKKSALACKQLRDVQCDL